MVEYGGSVAEKRLEYAKDAMLYVLRLMEFGASNQSDDDLEWHETESRQRQAENRVYAIRNSGEFNRLRRSNLPWVLFPRALKTEGYSREELFALADGAKHLKAGNCAERSAIAYQYLYRKGVRPLDRVHFKSPGDHVFVVIGRRREATSEDAADWGEDCVVCDPWIRRVCFAHEIRQFYQDYMRQCSDPRLVIEGPLRAD